MTGWIIVGSIAAVLLLLLSLRVRVLVSIDTAVCVTAGIGPVKWQLMPPPEKKPRRKKAAAKQSGGEGQQKKGKTRKMPHIHLTAADIRGALTAVWQAMQGALRRVGRRIRIDPLRLSLIFGDENPVNTAEWYGWVSAAVWTVMPRLEELTQLPDPRIHMEMDFDAGKTKISGSVGVSLRIGDLLAIGLAAAVPLLRFAIPFLRRQRTISRAEKKQAEQPSPASEHAA